MTAGYVTETILGFLLAVCCWILRQNIESRPCQSLKLWAKTFERGFEAFFTSAIYFTLSILVASNYALAKRDFDISANGFGIIETQITSAITVVSVLPLLYPVLMGFEKRKDAHQIGTPATRRADYNSNLHEKFRLVLFCLVTVLFMYPFISQCIHNWAPTDVGEGNGPDGATIVNSEEWAALTATCFEEIDSITAFETLIISAFELVGSLLSILSALWSVFIFFLRKSSTEEYRHTAMNHILVSTRGTLKRIGIPFIIRPIFQIALLLCPILLSVPLLWGIFRMRGVQKSLARATANLYLDNDWTFGQVVAIVLFIPVLFDMAYCWFEIEGAEAAHPTTTSPK